MTGPEDEATLATLADRLDVLTDLFKRRLFDDRAKQALIEDLLARLARADMTASATALKPLVDALAMVLERLSSVEPSADLVTSIAAELEYVLESVVGVIAISPSPGDPVDRLRHELVSASGEGPELRVADLLRAGYEKDGVVLRSAKVVAVRVMTGGGADGD